MLKGKPFLRRAMMTKTKKSKRTLSWKNNLSKCIKNRKCLKNRKCIKSRKCIRSCRKCLKSRTLRSRAQAKWQMPMQPRLHLRPPRSNSSISNITKPLLLLLLEAKGLASFGAAPSMEPRGCAAWLAILNTGVTTSSLSAATVTMASRACLPTSQADSALGNKAAVAKAEAEAVVTMATGATLTVQSDLVPSNGRQQGRFCIHYRKKDLSHGSIASRETTMD
ncbi:hypothetical protein V8C43DRAFT_18570 [Trichoderma afarasin]